MSWFHCYLADRIFHGHYCGGLPSPYEVSSRCHKDHSWGHSLSTISLTTCVVWSGTEIVFSLLKTSKFFVKENSPHDNLLMQSCAPGCCSVNFMKLSYKTPQLFPSLEKPNCSVLIVNCVNTLLHALTASNTRQYFLT